MAIAMRSEVKHAAAGLNIYMASFQAAKCRFLTVAETRRRYGTVKKIYLDGVCDFLAGSRKAAKAEEKPGKQQFHELKLS